MTEKTQTVPQVPANLSPQVQQALALLNVRFQDLTIQVNAVVGALMAENAELQKNLGKSNLPAVQKTPRSR
ncbi:MAG: hypothetical protein FWG55_05815 [Candidatus Bathyarchaeota archaeon]|nr:hypothetical protein [Candidatus Termiticorpusculum sp.]